MKTVDQMVSEMGYDPTPALNWAAGQMIAARWRRQYGSEPEKQMRDKTNPNPSVGAQHMKCVYPDFFEDTMREIIRDLDPDTAPQMDMFDGAA